MTAKLYNRVPLSPLSHLVFQLCNFTLPLLKSNALHNRVIVFLTKNTSFLCPNTKKVYLCTRIDGSVAQLD